MNLLDKYNKKFASFKLGVKEMLRLVWASEKVCHLIIIRVYIHSIVHRNVMRQKREDEEEKKPEIRKLPYSSRYE